MFYKNPLDRKKTLRYALKINSVISICFNRQWLHGLEELSTHARHTGRWLTSNAFFLFLVSRASVLVCWRLAYAREKVSRPTRLLIRSNTSWASFFRSESTERNRQSENSPGAQPFTECNLQDKEHARKTYFNLKRCASRLVLKHQR